MTPGLLLRLAALLAAAAASAAQPQFLSMSVDSPQTLTTLTYAWSHTLMPLTSPALAVDWGGSGTVQVKGTFQRTVASSQMQATFTLTLTNNQPLRPDGTAPPPMAVTNLALACPWGGSVLLPCGDTVVTSVTGGIVTSSAVNRQITIPAGQSATCMVNNLPVEGVWGVDFNQPCRILATNNLGSTSELNGVTLNFAAPTRFIKVNNCATWSVLCSQPAGSAAWMPSVGGMPQGREVCGNDANAPWEEQFGLTLGGGFIGDGTQPGACSGLVQTSCNSQLALQSTVGTSNAFGSTQSGASLTLQASLQNCPVAPPSPPPLPPPSPSPDPNQLQSSPDPVVTAQVTKTLIRGAFDWTTASSVQPPSQAVAAGASGRARYTITATREPAANAAPPVFLVAGAVRVANPADQLMRVQAVEAVVDGASVPLGSCSPALPADLPPRASLACSFFVNYNQGAKANLVFGRATVVAATGTRSTKDSDAGAPFAFDAASDASEATGACADVTTSMASDWLALARVGGEAPSLDAGAPSRVCSSTSWELEVEVSPKPGAPCGQQRVLNTVTASYLAAGGETRSRQGEAWMSVDVVSPECPGSTPGGIAAPGAAAPRGVFSEAGQPGGGGPITLEDVQTSQATGPVWTLSLEPRFDVFTKPPGSGAELAFTASWDRTSKPLFEYSGRVLLINPGGAELRLADVSVALVDSLAPGQPTVAEVPAQCISGSAVSAAAPLVIAPGASASCAFSLRSEVGGALTARAAPVGGGPELASAPRSVTTFLATQQACARLTTGLAASALGDKGQLLARGGVADEEVCGPGSKQVVFELPASAGGGSSAPACSYPVVALARLVPLGDAGAQPVSASGTADVAVEDCTASDSAASAALVGTKATKVRYMRWSVSPTTSPALPRAVLRAKSLNVSVLFVSTLEPGQRMVLGGELLVRNAAGLQQAQVALLPMCPGCAPIVLDLSCKPGAEPGSVACPFSRGRLAVQPLLVQALVPSARPSEAATVDPRLAGRRQSPLGRCARLSFEQQLAAPGGAPPARVRLDSVTGAPQGSVCDSSRLLTGTLRFEGVDCDQSYSYRGTAQATPDDAGVAAASAQLEFAVTC